MQIDDVNELSFQILDRDEDDLGSDVKNASFLQAEYLFLVGQGRFDFRIFVQEPPKLAALRANDIDGNLVQFFEILREEVVIEQVFVLGRL